MVKVLQEKDPAIRGVMIARVYFQNRANGEIKSLELFQALQGIEATQERLSLSALPIDHISIQFKTAEEVQASHDRLLELSSEFIRPYQQQLSYNSGDGSTQTKAVIRDSLETPFNKIIEFVHYCN